MEPVKHNRNPQRYPGGSLTFRLSTVKHSYQKGSTKRRTGCRQCKTRHRRCDETKPCCLNCTKSGLLCDFHFTWATLRMKETSQKPKASHVSEKPHLPKELDPLSGAYQSQNEWDTFKFFTESALKAGPLPAAELFALVTQVATRDAVLRTICCGIGALHLGIYTTALGPELQIRAKTLIALSLELYGQAVRAFRENFNSVDQGNATVLPALFAAFDLCFGDAEEAAVHLMHGLQMIGMQLAEQNAVSSSHNLPPKHQELGNATVDMLSRLTAHPQIRVEKFSKLHRQLRRISLNRRERSMLVMPPQFGSLDQALRWWSVVQEMLNHDMQSQSQPELDNFSLLSDWHASFKPLLLRARQLRSSQPYLYIHIHVLESLYLESLALLYDSMEGPKTVLPDIQQIYLDLVDLAQTTLEAEASNLDMEALLQHSLIRVLVFIAHKSGKGVVRDTVKCSLVSIPGAWDIIDTFSPIDGGIADQGVNTRSCEISRDWFFTTLGCSLRLYKPSS